MFCSFCQYKCHHSNREVGQYKCHHSNGEVGQEVVSIHVPTWSEETQICSCWGYLTKLSLPDSVQERYLIKTRHAWEYLTRWSQSPGVCTAYTSETWPNVIDNYWEHENMRLRDQYLFKQRDTWVNVTNMLSRIQRIFLKFNYNKHSFVRHKSLPPEL